MSSANTAQKARLFDLLMGALEMVREGKRDPEEVARVLQGIKESPFFLTRLFFRVWRTVTIGGNAKDQLLRKMEAMGQYVSPAAGAAIHRAAFTTLNQPMTLKLVRANIKDLGFTNPPGTTALFDRIKEIGFLCPAEVAVHLRIALTDQPRGDIFWIAMEPIVLSDDRPLVFCIRQGEDYSMNLGTTGGEPDELWGIENDIVFVACED